MRREAYLIAFLMPHCPVTVVQRYRDGVCSLLFHLFFIIFHPYIPLHLEEMIFYTCIQSVSPVQTRNSQLKKCFTRLVEPSSLVRMMEMVLSSSSCIVPVQLVPVTSEQTVYPEGLRRTVAVLYPSPSLLWIVGENYSPVTLPLHSNCV